MSDEQFRPEDAAPPPPRPDSQGDGSTPPPQPAHPYTDLPPNVVEQNPDARMWGMFCHLAGLIGYAVGGVPGIKVIGPLICWQVKKDEYPFVDDQGKEALNFQITISIAALAVGVIGFVTMCIYVGFLIWIVGGFAIMIYDVVATIMAAVKANNGEYYRYPLTLRLIK
jgi:uncharacterized Tic20 family protein